ncbi:MAG: AmmeMemoRadiSam system protein A [Candidatus Woesearchaeota archaeon]
MLKKEDGKELIKLAKEAIKSYFKQKSPEITEAAKKKFSEKKGVFVTLKKGEQLRGCIGYIEARFPLWEAVANSAKNAAFGDPRFPPITEEELKEITFEISILTEPKQITGDIQKQIKIGKHGLIVKKDGYSGLLLPQVFTEWQVDAEGALEMTCEKAGLPAGSWQERDTKVYVFECQVFSE